MSSRSLPIVDPELVGAISALHTIDLSPAGLPAFRALLNSRQPGTEADPHDLTIRDLRIPGPTGAPEVGVRVIEPTERDARAPAILHMHGGGFVAGAPHRADEQNAHWARNLRCVVVSVDYRLAPETPCPGALEDCYAALAWMSRHADAMRLDASRIVIAGESAGGGLAAALALLARDRSEFSIRHQLLTYPMLDDRTTAEVHPYCGEFVWTAELNHAAWTAYLGHEPNQDHESVYAAPARARDLTGLPPTFLALGSLDLFFDENLEFARRLCRAGVPVELHVYPGAFHGFGNVKQSSMYRRYQADRLLALQRAF